MITSRLKNADKKDEIEMYRKGLRKQMRSHILNNIAKVKNDTSKMSGASLTNSNFTKRVPFQVGKFYKVLDQ